MNRKLEKDYPNVTVYEVSVEHDLEVGESM